MCRHFAGCAGLATVWWVLSGSPAAPAQYVQTPKKSAPAANPIPITAISYADAKAIVTALRDSLPAALRQKTPADIESGWPAWVSRQNAEIRRRLDQGDEDSVINLWYYGTSFTKHPRLSARNIAKLDDGARAADRILLARLEDLIAGIESPGRNERLQFARDVVEQNGIDPRTAVGKEQMQRFLLEGHKRMLAERESRDRRMLDSNVNFTLFRDRGLSSDTSLLADFSIDVALQTLKARGTLAGVRRVAIIGPGLDFADKADGYDFYPQQTIQPFALVDSLRRYGLAALDDLQVITFDLNQRVNRHLEDARRRARTGEKYVLQLPLDRDEKWSPALLAYWRRLGDTIGEEAKPAAAPADAGSVQVRAVGVRPDVVTSITPQSLNIVLERLLGLPADQRFDLIVATNILVYYDLFEQNLALANIATMLQPEGLLVSNTRVFPSVPLKLLDDYVAITHRDGWGDYIYFYQRHEDRLGFTDGKPRRHDGHELPVPEGRSVGRQRLQGFSTQSVDVLTSKIAAP